MAGGITMTNTAHIFETDGICYKTEEHNDVCEDILLTSSTTIPKKPTSSSLDIDLEEIYDFVKNVDKEETYIQKDENSMIIILPLDAKIGNSTVNIDFSE